MDIIIRNNQESLIIDQEETPCYLVSLDDEWFKKQNTLKFKLSLEKAIKNAKGDENKIIHIYQKDIVDNYRKMDTPSCFRNIKRNIKYIIKKPTYVLLFLSLVLTITCFIGKVFLYGYYFSKPDSKFSGLLSIFINPIPIDIFSSGVLGVFVIILFIIVTMGFLCVFNNEVKWRIKLLIMVTLLVVLTVFPMVLFVDLNGRTIEFGLYACLAMALFPYSIALVVIMTFKGALRPFITSVSFIISVILSAGAICLISRFDILSDWRLLIAIIGPLTLWVLLVVIFDRIVPVKVRCKVSTSGSKLTKYKKSTYSSWKTSIQQTALFTVVFMIVMGILSIYLIYNLGGIYSSIPYNSQYSVITYNERNSMDANVVLGTIIGERNDTYYISRYKDKALITIKNSEVFSRTAFTLENKIGIGNFSNLTLIKEELIEKEGTKFCIEYVKHDEQNSYHLITDKGGSYIIKVFFKELETKEVDKIHINIIKTQYYFNVDKEISQIKDFYFKYFGLEKLNIVKDNFYYLNGTYSYTRTEHQDRIEEDYYFKTNY